MLRPPPPPGPDSTERSAPRALCGADAAGARGRGHARPRPSPSGLHTHTQIHTHILTNPEAAFAGWSPGAPPPSWRVRTVSPRRAPQLDSKRIWPANVCARLGAALSGKVRGTCLLQGQERLWWPHLGDGRLQRASVDHPAVKRSPPAAHPTIKSFTRSLGEEFPDNSLSAPRGSGDSNLRCPGPGRPWQGTSLHGSKVNYFKGFIKFTLAGRATGPCGECVCRPMMQLFRLEISGKQ